MPKVQLLVTGSSSLDLAAETKESLVGRKFDYHLLPLSFVEMCAHHGYLSERSLLENRMVFGYYPEVVKSEPALAQKILNSLTEGLMYKDLLTLDQLKKPSLLVKIPVRSGRIFYLQNASNATPIPTTSATPSFGGLPPSRKLIM